MTGRLFDQDGSESPWHMDIASGAGGSRAKYRLPQSLRKKMANISIAQPDITLHLDAQGVIREAAVSSAIPESDLDGWIGRPWSETVADVGDGKVQQMLDAARKGGVSGFRQVNQRFPNGLELPIEYSTVRLGGKAGLMAIGKNLQAVAELQSRLIAAQQAMERDYWKVREVETRYRLLFDATNEAVLLIRSSNLHIVEANPAAIRALGIASGERDLLAEVAPSERKQLTAMLDRVREDGKAPAILLNLGQEREPWLVRASLMTSQPGSLFLVQLSPAGMRPGLPPDSDAVPLEDLVAQLPDGFVVVDTAGTILKANNAFLDLSQVGAEKAAVGQSLARWLGRPGADLTVLLANVRKHGFVRIFSTTFHGDLGTDSEVEISAAGFPASEPREVGVLIRDVGQRLPLPGGSNRLGDLLGTLSAQVGKAPLRKLVKETIGVVEQHYVEAALELTGGNRTAAAELLGLSRQSLYAKLGRYGLDGSSPTRR